MKNGTSTGQSITLAETIAKGYVALGTPVSYVVGDTIGFRTVLGGSAANARMTALLIEDGVVVTPPAFVAPIPWKHVKVLGSTDVTNGYVDLPHLAIGNTIVAATGRLCIHENQDYTVSNSGGVSRITFVNDLASAGEEAAASGDTFYFTYQY
jgi:hypothetical protein